MRNSQYWYLIQYDIKCPKRGQRIFRTLKSRAFAVQKSVFIWQGTAQELNELKQLLTEKMNLKEDDIRGYLIQRPLLLFGQNPFIEDSYFTGYPPHQLCSLDWLSDPPQTLWN